MVLTQKLFEIDLFLSEAQQSNPTILDKAIKRSLSEKQTQKTRPSSIQGRFVPARRNKRGQLTDPCSLIRRTRHIERNYLTVINFANCRGPRSLARADESGERGMA